MRGLSRIPHHGSRTTDPGPRIADHGSRAADLFAHERWEAYLRANAESSGTACGRTAAETIDGIARRENESFVRIKRETDQRTARQHLLGVGGTVNRNPVQPASPRDSINDIEIAMRIEREPLRPAESVVEHFDGSVGCDSVHRIARRKRRGSDVEAPIGPERQMKCRHARRYAREHRRAPLANPKNRSGAIAYEQRAISSERDAARDTEIGGDHRDGSVCIDAVHAPIETARDMESAVRAERQRRWIGKIRDERLARPVWPHDENRDRALLPAGSAERDVDVTLGVDGRAIYLMKAGGERRPDFDVRSFSCKLIDADRGMATFETGRNDRRQRCGRGGRKSRRNAAYCYPRQDWFDR